MRLLLAIGLLVLLCWPLGVAILRSNQLFVLRVEAGKVRFLRGRMPQGLLDDLADVVRGSSAQGTLICISEDQRPRLTARGEFDAGLLQQLRNVVGLYPIQRIRAGGKPRGR